MATAYYPAIIERAGDGYSVFFPDVPGCVSAGRSVGEAIVNAETALGAHFQLMAAGNEVIPQPSEFDSIERDPEVDEVARSAIRAELPGKAIRLNITLDESLVHSIDRIAKNRSGFLADAARELLAKRRREETRSA